jgi:AraC-like DNA-binding protein
LKEGPPLTERLFLSLPGDASPGPETDTPKDRMQALPVPPDLRCVIRQALRYQETFPDGGSVWERVLPDGAVRIVVTLAPAPTVGTLLVVGPRVSPDMVLLSGRMDGFSFALAPGWAQAVLGRPVHELADRAVPLADLWGDQALALADQLLATRHGDEGGAPLWPILRARLADRNGAAPPALLSALAGMRRRGPRSVRQVAGTLGVTERRLQQLCREHLGLGPRSLLRLRRFQRLLSSVRSVGRPDWASLALEHGYCDQAHLVREFRRITGLAPSVYHRRAISRSSKTAG